MPTVQPRRVSAITMPRREDSLIAEIERDALDDHVPLARTLRKCIVLGGKSGSVELRDWASRELQGYLGTDDLPSYRVIGAPLMVDGIAGNHQVTGQQFPASGIPEFAREVVSERLELRHGVGGLEALIEQDTIKLQPPGASDLVRIMNSESENPYQHIVSLYWSVSGVAVRGVLDHIRTALTQLVAEVRSSMSPTDTLPSADAADQAVSVVVTGRRARVNVASVQASGRATATMTTEAGPAEESGFWTRARRIGAFVVGLAGVIAAVLAVAEFVH
jgi:hypothetical protein